jgi:hypothetical protein
LDNSADPEAVSQSDTALQKNTALQKKSGPAFEGRRVICFLIVRSRTFEMNVCSSCTNERLTFSILGWSITAVVIALFVFNAFALTG